MFITFDMILSIETEGREDPIVMYDKYFSHVAK